MNQNSAPSGYGIAALALVASWFVLCAPWLFGDVSIPYDAKAHFQAQVQFLANALHTGQSPFWNPYVFAGSPQIADPQSMILSPAVLIALFDPTPSFQLVDGFTFGLMAFGGFSILMLFRDRGWHPAGAIVAALGFAFGASAAWRIQHIGQVQSFAFFAIALWLLARALDRQSIRWGIAAGVATGLMIVEPDQVAFLAALVLAGFVLHHWVDGDGRAKRFAESVRPLLAAGLTCFVIAALPLLDDRSVRDVVEPAEYRVPRSDARIAAPRFAADAAVQRSLRRLRQGGAVLGALQSDVEPQRDHAVAEHEPALYRRAADRADHRSRLFTAPAARARDPLLHRRDTVRDPLRAWIEHALLPPAL